MQEKLVMSGMCLLYNPCELRTSSLCKMDINASPSYNSTIKAEQIMSNGGHVYLYFDEFDVCSYQFQFQRLHWKIFVLGTECRILRGACFNVGFDGVEIHGAQG
jgi:hypothetical protein